MAVTSMVGADPDQLDALAREMNEAAQRLRALEASLAGRVRAAPWAGMRADRFRTDWAALHARTIAAAVSGLSDAATAAARNATDQREASSGADARHVGRVPAESPSIPPAPPNPSTDKGAGKHGSDPWYTRGDDLVFKEILESRVVPAADAMGLTHAAANLRHYLENSGAPVSVDPDQIMRDVPQFSGAVDTTVEYEIRRVVAEAQQTGNYGIPMAFDSGWHGYYVTKEQSPDWFYAMGGIQYAATGVVVVWPPETPGGDPRVSVDYKVHVFDRYNWDGGKETEIGPVTVTDEQMGELHRAGLSQEYNIAGSTDRKHFDGQLPVGTPVELPEAPDDREGTRTDPGRGSDQ